uniref:Uncharacterized protein n=1 Tax=Eutreptiella gymnastica TaxID=73025 RepID=A0A7S1J1H1_9EUGL|mmetsp:Transcript_58975/g.105181  ORF Transcript_58975/g.105181 Transcript_58975/m.105181 type:complete len:117 (+) Transcript_58975:228-578(+)
MGFRVRYASLDHDKSCTDQRRHVHSLVADSTSSNPIFLCVGPGNAPLFDTALVAYPILPQPLTPISTHNLTLLCNYHVAPRLVTFTQAEHLKSKGIGYLPLRCLFFLDISPNPRLI